MGFPGWRSKLKSQKEGEQSDARRGPRLTRLDLPDERIQPHLLQLRTDLSSQPLSVVEKCQLLELRRKFSFSAARRRVPQTSESGPTHDLRPGDLFLTMNQQPLCGGDRRQGKCSEVSPSTGAHLELGKMADSGDLETDGSPVVVDIRNSPLQWLGVTDAPSCQCDRDEISVTQTSGPSCGIVKVGEKYLTLRGQELCVTKDSPQCGSLFQMTNGRGTRGGQPVFFVTLDFCRGSGPPVYVCVPPQCREGELPILLEPFSSSPFIDLGERKQINPDARRLVFTEVLDPDRRKFHLRPLDFPRMCVCLSQDKLVGLDERHGDLIADFDFLRAGAQTVIARDRGKKKKKDKRRSKVSQDSGFVADSPTQRRPDRDPTLASDDSLTSSSSADSLPSRPACSPPWNSFRGEALNEGDASSSEGGAAEAQTRRGRRRRNVEMCCTVS